MPRQSLHDPLSSLRIFSIFSLERRSLEVDEYNYVFEYQGTANDFVAHLT